MLLLFFFSLISMCKTPPVPVAMAMNIAAANLAEVAIALLPQLGVGVGFLLSVNQAPAMAPVSLSIRWCVRSCVCLS